MQDLEDRLFSITIPTLSQERMGSWLFLYKRFIDDLIILVDSRTHAQWFLDRLGEMHPAIKLDVKVSDTSVDFMDVTIFKSSKFDTTGQLSTKLFQKKLNAFLYIHPRSMHPPHIFPAFIRERLLAIRKFCSEEEDFVWAKANFKERLLKRGYSEDMLKTVFGKETPSQDDLLFPAALNSATSKDKSHKPLVFTTTFSHLTSQLPLRALLEPGMALFDEDAMALDSF